PMPMLMPKGPVVPLPPVQKSSRLDAVERDVAELKLGLAAVKQDSAAKDDLRATLDLVKVIALRLNETEDNTNRLLGISEKQNARLTPLEKDVDKLKSIVTVT